MSVTAWPQTTTNIFSDCSEVTLRDLVSKGGVIRGQCSSAIILGSPLVITRDLTITTTNSLALSGGSKTRLFVVNPGVTLTLEGVGLFSGRQTATNTLTGGIDDTAGAAIYNNGGTVRLINVTVQDHQVVGYPGAAGADDNTGGDGEAGGDAAGAAIFNNGGLLVSSNSIFSGNIATGGSGGRGGNGIRGYVSNGGNGGRGGAAGGAAIYSQNGTLQLYTTIFTNNQSLASIGGGSGAPSGLGLPGEGGAPGDALGGAISGDGASIIISACTFVTNIAKGADGVAGSNAVRNLKGSDGKSGGYAAGAAVFNRGTLRMTNSTLLFNTATGGKGGNGGNGSASGVFGSDGGRGGNGGDALGAGLDNRGESTVINCTFSGNSAVAGAGGTGGNPGGSGADRGESGSSGNTGGGGVRNISRLELGNTIVANSVGNNFSGTLTDLGGNISSDNSYLFLAQNSRFNTAPGLGALAANGGRTPTLAITTNSPAYNTALASLAPPTDQRGTNRVAPPDVGAFEIYTPTPADTNPTNITINPTAQRAGNSIVISFPAGNTNIFLEYTTNLKSNLWTTVSSSSLRQTNDTLSLSISSAVANPTQRFFRLRAGASTNSNFPPGF